MSDWEKKGNIISRKALKTAAQRKRFRHSWGNSDNPPKGEVATVLPPKKTQEDQDKDYQDYQEAMDNMIYTDKEKRSMQNYYNQNRTLKGWRYSDPDGD